MFSYYVSIRKPTTIFSISNIKKKWKNDVFLNYRNRKIILSKSELNNHIIKPFLDFNVKVHKKNEPH